MATQKLKGQPGDFQAANFTAAKFATAAEKADIANKITKFILGGFQRGSFNKKMYQRMCSMFGHIAHYDLNGFYEVWFIDNQACLRWAENLSGNWLVGIGDPQYTWSDVEKKLAQWVKDNQIAEQLDVLHRAEAELKERTLLAALQQKYSQPIDEILPQVTEGELIPVAIPALQIEDIQLTLF